MTADRATTFQAVQIGLETTPGVAVAASKLIQSFSLEPSIKPNIKLFRPAGQKFNRLAIPGKEHTEWKVSGYATYTEMLYLLASIVEKVTPSADGATAKVWTMDMDNVAADVIATYTLEQGSPDRGHRAPYGVVSEFGLDFDREKVDLSGNVIAGKLTDDIAMSANEVVSIAVTGGTATSGGFTLTFGGQTTASIDYNAAAAAVEAALEALSTIGTGNVECAGGAFPGTAITIEFVGDLKQTDVGAITAADTFNEGTVTPTIVTAGVAPSEIDLVPILPEQISIYMEDAQASLDDADELERVLSGSFKISDRFAPVWVLNAANPSWVAYVEKPPKIELKLLLEADAEGMALLPTMREGDQKVIRIQATGADISTGVPFLFQIDMAGFVSNVGEFKDNDGVYALEWTFEAKQDATWGHALVVILENAIASL